MALTLLGDSQEKVGDNDQGVASEGVEESKGDGPEVVAKGDGSTTT